MLNYIPLDQCIDRHLYRIHSRNLTHGVFNQSANGFIGIREKFSQRFLFTEFHWDTGVPYGTVKPLEDLGEIPADLLLQEFLGSEDQTTHRPVEYDHDGKGWKFIDTGELSKDIRPVAIDNQSLFNYLDSQKSVL